MLKFKKEKMGKKKKIVLISLLSLFILSIVLILLVYLTDKDKNTGEIIGKDTSCKIIDKVEIVLGDKIPESLDFVKNCNSKVKIKFYLNNKSIDSTKITSAGTYKVEIEINGEKYYSELLIKEKNNDSDIDFEVTDKKISYGDKYKVDDFVKKCKIGSSSCKLSFEKEEMNNYTTPGEYELVIVGQAGDKRVSKKVKLTIEKVSDGNSVQKTKTITETVNNSEYYKYGVTIDTVTTIYYEVYSDGNKKEINRETSSSYNYDNFNATTNDMLGEATNLFNSNYGTAVSVLSYVNQYRSEVGALPLTLDDNLSIAASIRALELGWSKKFAHERPNGNSCFSVLDDLGISYWDAGENIAYGYFDAASVSNGWRNSEGHYQNMISTSFNKIGVGVAEVEGTLYWVQLFTS